MSAGTSWLGRVSASFAETRAAWKAVPRPASLYPPPQSQTYYPIAFPGWDELEKRQPGQAKDQARVKTALQSPAVFANLQAIANEASTAELVVTRRQPDGTDEDIDGHPLETLWQAPNPHMGRSFLVKFWAWSYILTGKAYLFWAPGANSGRPRECWPLPPFMLMPLPDDTDFIGGYAFKSSPAAKPVKIDRKYITFSHSVNIFDVRDGLSFLASAMLAIESDIFAAQWNRNFFGESNGVPDGLITVPHDILDSDLATVRQEIRDFFGGTRRGVAVARAGDMDYKPFGRTQKDAEWLEGRRFDAQTIGRAMGFPDGYWSESANRANAEQARATMIAQAVWPMLVTLSEDMNAQTVPVWFGDGVRASFKDIRPEDRELKLKETETRSKFLTIDELREEEGRDPIGDARGKLLVAEIGKGMTDASDPAAATAADDLPPAEIAEDGETPPETPPDGSGATEEGEAMAETAKSLDKRRWQAKATKALKAGKAAAVAFTPEALTADEAAAITAALRDATTVEAVKAAFQSTADRADELISETYTEALAWARAAMEGDDGQAH